MLKTSFCSASYRRVASSRITKGIDQLSSGQICKELAHTGLFTGLSFQANPVHTKKKNYKKQLKYSERKIKLILFIMLKLVLAMIVTLRLQFRQLSVFWCEAALFPLDSSTKTGYYQLHQDLLAHPVVQAMIPPEAKGTVNISWNCTQLKSWSWSHPSR